MKLTTLLNLIPVVGPAIAAAPEFIALFNEAKALLKEDDQEVAQQAYDLAISKAKDSHQRLQDLVSRYGG